VLELIAARRADDVVLSAADAVVTVPELRQWAADLATLMRAEGIAGPGVVVTTPPVPSAALVAVFLAVFEVGAVLAYGRKHERAGAFVRHADDEPSGWLITTGPRFDPVSPARTADLNGPAWRVPHRGPGHGAVLSHRSLTATLTAVADRLGVTPDDDVLLLDGAAPPHPVDLLLPLVRGRSLLLARQEGAEPSGPPGAFVVADAPTWRAALTGGWQPPAGTRLVCRSDVIAPDLVDMLVRTGHPVFLGHTTPPYGVPAGLAPLDLSRGRHLGPPLPGTTRRLVDLTGAPVPPGVVGDLHVAGTGHPGEPTGLRCRHTRDGDLELVGLTPDRLVVGDHAVPLPAVEHELAGLPEVRAAAVVAAGGVAVAWVVPDAPLGTDRERDAFAARVRSRAQALLPPHEVPAVIAALDELPTSADGTVDRAALPAPPRPQAHHAEADVRPRTPVERRALGIFRDVVPVREFGMHADFFALGGHSLLAAKLISRVHAEFGVLVPIRDFFRDPSPAGLAAAIERLERERDERAAGGRGSAHDRLAGMSDDEIDQLLGQLR
jgi:hypothetical protein